MQQTSKLKSDSNDERLGQSYMLFIVMVVNYQVSNTRKINPDGANGIWTTETCAVFDTFFVTVCGYI